MQLAERFKEVMALDPASWAIEFEGRQYSWGELKAFADAIGRAVRDAGAKQYDPVGWVAENTPSTIAAMVGLTIHDHCACVINPHLGPKILAEEIAAQKFPVILGDAHFWNIPGVVDAAKSAGSAGLVLNWETPNGTITPYPGLERVGPGAHREPMPGYVVERVSSGTTGPPKRLPETNDAIMNTLAYANRKATGPDQGPITLKTSPSIMFKSLAHGGGAFGVTLALYEARPISLHQKFTVDRTIDAFHKHKAKVGQFVPTMIKMIWDADVPPEKLSSLVAIRSGTAPLDPDLQARFEEKYGVPILIDYGATEFGSVAAWNITDHKQFAKQKRGSVGRAVPGVEIRVVDQETGAEITDGESLGILEVKLKANPEWVRTADLAIVDKDGFLYIRGRADDAIVRGGFKVLPNDVIGVLQQHPDVADVVVVGVPDERLGQVPVAVIEPRQGAKPTPEALKAFAKERLTPYQVPVAYKIVDKIPRSASMKAIKPEIMKIALGQ